MLKNLPFCETICNEGLQSQPPSSPPLRHSRIEPAETKAAKLDMNILGFTLGIVSILVFVAMAFCNTS